MRVATSMPHTRLANFIVEIRRISTDLGAVEIYQTIILQLSTPQPATIRTICEVNTNLFADSRMSPESNRKMQIMCHIM